MKKHKHNWRQTTWTDDKGIFNIWEFCRCNAKTWTKMKNGKIVETHKANFAKRVWVNRNGTKEMVEES